MHNKVDLLREIGRAMQDAENSGRRDEAIQRVVDRLTKTPRARSFSIVDQKAAEAEFFLMKMRDGKFNFFEIQCYSCAFLSSVRSITLSW